MKNWRNWVLLFGLAIVLVLVNREILAKRAVIANGKLLMLELRPVDPRSMIQGDYMALAFADTSAPPSETISSMPFSGTVILTLDANGVGHYARPDDHGPLNNGEMRIHYRRYKEWVSDRVSYTARSFFFQEGQAEDFARAKFAVLRVDDSGRSVLVGLADEHRQTITVTPESGTP